MATIALYANQMNQMPGLIKDVTKSVTDYKSELSALKAKTLTINKSVCDLEDVIRSIQTSTQTQEQKSTSLDTFNNNCEDFIAEVVRIDGDVADRINTRKKEFYAQYYYLKPEYEKTWLEVIKDWFTAVREWCRQKWELQTEERAVRCVRMHKEAVVFLTVGVLGQKQVKEGEMPRYLKEFLKQLRTNPDRIIMNAEQIKKYEELKRWPDWWGKEDGSDTVDKLPEDDREGIFVGYLSFGANGLVDNDKDGFFTLYDAPTVSTKGECYNFSDLYEKYGLEPYGALQSFGGKGSALNKNGISNYGNQTYNPEKGTLVYNGIERYGIAIGPMLQNPECDLSGAIDPIEMAYGTCVDIKIQVEDKTYYIPAIIVDVKAHSAPTGIFQTGVPFTGSYENTGRTGAIIEWYVTKEQNGNNISVGLNKYNSNSSIIIYRDEVLK